MIKKSTEAALDDVDKAILRALQNDGGLSNVELAKRVKLSPPATHARRGAHSHQHRVHRSEVNHCPAFRLINQEKQNGKDATRNANRTKRSVFCFVALLTLNYGGTMTTRLDDFRTYRQKMNDRILEKDFSNLTPRRKDTKTQRMKFKNFAPWRL